VTVPASKAPPLSGKLFFKASWGSGKEQLGKLDAKESNPEAPLALSLDSQGNVYVLDQANGRISRLDKDGQVLPPLQVTQQTPRDLAVSPTGTLLVMDNMRDKSIAVLDPGGLPLGELPLSGKNLEAASSAMGLTTDSSGVYVERADGMTVRLGDAAGTPDPERPLLDGRPSRDGSSLLSMAVIQAETGRFWVRSVDGLTGQMKFMREYVLPTPIMYLNLLASDAAGRIYVAANVARELPIDDPATGNIRTVDASVQLLCLSSMGEVQKVLTLPPSTVPHETVRELTVREDGLIFYMHRTEEGVQLLQYSCG
jgi:DNA-binding beta-propeller fold protein YncE